MERMSFRDKKLWVLFIAAAVLTVAVVTKDFCITTTVFIILMILNEAIS